MNLKRISFTLALVMVLTMVFGFLGKIDTKAEVVIRETSVVYQQDDLNNPANDRVKYKEAVAEMVENNKMKIGPNEYETVESPNTRFYNTNYEIGGIECASGACIGFIWGIPSGDGSHKEAGGVAVKISNNSSKSVRYTFKVMSLRETTSYNEITFKERWEAYIENNEYSVLVDAHDTLERVVSSSSPSQVKQIILSMKEVGSSSTELETLKAKIKELEAEIAKLKQEKQGLQTKVDSAEAENAELKTQVQEKTTEVENSNKKITELENKIKTLEENSTANTEEINKLKTELAAEKAKNQDLNNQIAELNKKISNLEKENKDLKDKLATATQKITELEKKIKDKDAKIAELEAQLAEKDKIIAQKDNQIKNLEAERDNKQKQIDSLTTDLNKVKSDLAASGNENQALKDKIAQLEAQIAQLKADKEGLNAEILKLKAEIAQLKGQLAEKDKNIEALNKKAAELQKEIDDLKNHIESLDEIIAKLKAEKDNLNKQIENANNELDKAKEDLENLKKELEDTKAKAEADKAKLQSELDEAKDKIADLDKKIADNDAAKQKLQEELDKEKAKADADQNKIKDLEKQIADKDNENANLNNEKSTLENKVKDLENQIAEKDKTIEDLNNQIVDKEKAITDLENKIKELEKEKADLEEKIKALLDSDSKKDELIKKLQEQLDKVNKALEDAKNKNNTDNNQAEADRKKLANEIEKLKKELEEARKALEEKEIKLEVNDIKEGDRIIYITLPKNAEIDDRVIVTKNGKEIGEKTLTKTDILAGKTFVELKEPVKAGDVIVVSIVGQDGKSKASTSNTVKGLSGRALIEKLKNLIDRANSVKDPSDSLLRAIDRATDILYDKSSNDNDYRWAIEILERELGRIRNFDKYRLSLNNDPKEGDKEVSGRSESGWYIDAFINGRRIDYTQADYRGNFTLKFKDALKGGDKLVLVASNPRDDKEYAENEWKIKESDKNSKLVISDDLLKAKGLDPRELVVFPVGQAFYNIVKNGNKTTMPMDTVSFNDNGRIMLPMRYAAYAMGFNVEWNNNTREAIFTNKDNPVLAKRTIKVQIDTGNVYDTDGNVYTFDRKPVNMNGRIHVSISNIAKAFGATTGYITDGVDQTIEWDQAKQAVYVLKYVK